MNDSTIIIIFLVTNVMWVFWSMLHLKYYHPDGKPTVELPRGTICYGCPHLEMETDTRGWCTLEVGVLCNIPHGREGKKK
jgi:hypothetical protein